MISVGEGRMIPRASYCLLLLGSLDWLGALWNRP